VIETVMPTLRVDTRAGPDAVVATVP
jgi:hypothetical protein